MWVIRAAPFKSDSSVRSSGGRYRSWAQLLFLSLTCTKYNRHRILLSLLSCDTWSLRLATPYSRSMWKVVFTPVLVITIASADAKLPYEPFSRLLCCPFYTKNRTIRYAYRFCCWSIKNRTILGKTRSCGGKVTVSNEISRPKRGSSPFFSF